MQKIEAEKFFKIQRKFSHIPFSQSEGWYNYMASKKNKIVFFVDNEEDSKIAFWGREQKIPLGLGCVLRIDGECYQPDLSDQVFTKVYSSIIEMEYTGIEIDSATLYNINYEIGLRRAGFVSPISLSSCPLSIEIDFIQPLDFNRNWQRNVKKAIKSDLIFSEITDPDAVILNRIVDMFKEMAQLKNLGYQLEFDSLTSLTSSKDIRVFMVNNRDGRPIAARIIHEHNKYLTDIYAANSIEARDCGATYFIMDAILNKLKEEGKSYFDFGRIPPSNHSTDSVYVFKISSRGKKVQYNGEWVYYKNPIIEGLMYLYKRFIIKKQRY